MNDFGGLNSGGSSGLGTNVDSDIESLLNGTKSSDALASPEQINGDGIQSGSESVDPTVDQDSDLTEDADDDLSELEEVVVSGGRGGELTWSDVGSIWNFGVQFSKAPEKFRNSFQSLTECYGDTVEIARELLSPNYRLGSINTIMGIIDARRNNDMMFVLELGVRLGSMSVEEMRALVKTSNVIATDFTPEPKEAITVNYRRNMDSGEVIKTIMTALSEIGPEGDKFLTWTQSILSTWPGGQ